MIMRALVGLTVALLLAMPSQAASFDCAKAVTPFEKAICENPDLSLADEVLAKSFATAIGGLTKQSTAQMRTDQRNWLDFAQRACTDTAEPMARGRYDDKGASCLVDIFGDRSTALEGSRMMGGHRFLIASAYNVLPDPEEVDNPDSYWKVATHSIVVPQLDADDPLAPVFNAWVQTWGEDLESSLAIANWDAAPPSDPLSDSSVSLTVTELGGRNRITLDLTTTWFGHGAAHGNYSLGKLHYYVPEAREIIASDIFSGANWKQALADVAWAQMQVEHGDNLFATSVNDIADIVAEPMRWDFSSDRNLVIQFLPYEISAYAYGAPTITIPWDRLAAIKSDSQDSVLYGW